MAASNLHLGQTLSDGIVLQLVSIGYDIQEEAERAASWLARAGPRESDIASQEALDSRYGMYAECAGRAYRPH